MSVQEESALSVHVNVSGSLFNSMIHVIPPDKALAAFNTEDGSGIQPALAIVKRYIDEWKTQEHSVDTKAGRDAIRSFAHKIAKSGSALSKVGKAVADEVKKIPKNVDASRRLLAKTIDDWHDEVRKPLTDWETADEARKEKHQTAIRAIEAMGSAVDVPAAEIKSRLEVLGGMVLGPECEEFQINYVQARHRAIELLGTALVKREVYEAEQAELARLRTEAKEREQQDYEEKLRREGEERAKGNVAVTAPAAAPQLVDALPSGEPVDPNTQLEHVRQVNRTALAALVEGGIPEATAKRVISLIAAGKVPAMTISY